MTHFLRRQTVAQVLAATLVLSATLAGAQETPAASAVARPLVTVRLYGTAQVSARTRDAALAAAAHALSDAVDVSWRDPAGADAHHPGELIIQLVRSSASTPRPMRFALGEAVIGVRTGAGVFATVYVDCVETLAALSKSNAALLLGHAVAHELGHLLLKTSDHTKGGLMRANWTPQDIRRNRSEDWLLSREDAEAIQQRLRQTAS